VTTPVQQRLLDLQADLQTALLVEHATIPVYFAAWASLQTSPGSSASGSSGNSNVAVQRVLRSVMVEEMLHLTQVANLLIAVGGTPRLTSPGFVLPPTGTLPFSQPPIPVEIRPFSPEALAVFLDIERPMDPGTPGEDRNWTTIGQFYESIKAQYAVVLQDDPNLPGQNMSRQIAQAAYYGAGLLVLIDGADSAQIAISEIMDQGEGTSFGVFDDDASIFGQDGKEPAHYYRFLQLELGRAFAPGDTPASGPTGARIAVSFDDVNPMRPNATRDDYASYPEIQALLDSFNTLYGAMLTTFELAFNGGGSAAFQQATASMFALGDLAAGITRTADPTTPGSTVGLTFAPIFADALVG
jgi:hypothetical protein